MKIKTKLRLSLITLLFAIICCISDNQFIDPFDSKPKIVVKDGHIIFETARNKNITFKSSAGGRITVDGQDLTRIVELAKSANLENDRTSSSKLRQIEESLDQLKTQYSNLGQSLVEMRVQQTAFNDSTNKLNQILGTGANALLPETVRRALRKIQRLDTSLNRLTQLLEKNECESNPCRNGGTCADTYNGFICKCSENWEGVTCDTDVNECQRFLGTELGCQNSAQCINSPGSYSCVCTANWFGIHCTEQRDDCSSASNEALCGHGTCLNQQRSIAGIPNYRCICDQGWTTSGHNPACIVDIDECTDRRPHCSVSPPVTCINLPGSFYCGPCPLGFTGNGYYCYDINECETNNGGCSQSPRVQCTNTLGSRICGSCPPGYNGNGITCEFVGTCRINNGGCHPSAQCFENMAISTSFRECRCPSGYMGSGVGPNGCVSQSGTTCDNNPCIHGSCIPNGNTFSCFCNSGYSGSLCELEVNECLSNPCQNGGTCSDQQNGFLCVCSTGWQGSTCAEPQSSCGGTISAELGSIVFPNAPNAMYPNRVSCAWVVNTTPGKVLNVTFRSFSIEQTTDCSYDFLQIHDGPNAGAHSLGRFCGHELPKGGNIVTTHHQIYLWFKSDHSIAHEGFQLDWNTTDPVCGGELEVRDYGAFNSPGYPGNYPHNRDCYWMVRVPLGKRIQFHFATLQIERHPDCSFDYLEVFDGQRESDPLLGKYCNSTTPPPLVTSGSSTLIHFHTDDSMTDHGFHITYSVIPGIAGCGGTLTSEKGSLTSPNFPERYDNNVECDWTIRVHPLERIEIRFNVFDLENHNNCRFDYLEVREGVNSEAPLIIRLCGQEMPQPIVSTGNKLWVKFRADASFTGQGFKADYTTVCGGLFTELEGDIKSPFFPDPYPSDRKCLYHIVLPPGHLVQLSFQYFDVEGSIDCTYDYLEVRESHENGTDLGRFCGDVIPDTITSQYNELWLKFGTDGSVSNHGFYANYTNIEVGCGGVYTTNHGSITTPNHPNFYPHSARCSWLIRADLGFVVRLTFTVFALEDHSTCNYDYVEVKDSNNAVIGKYCGTRIPPVLTSTGNQIFISFKSDRRRAQEGFAAAYSFMDVSTSCGGNYFTDSGAIRSPGYPSTNYPPQRDCVWKLQVQNGRQIVLHINNFTLEGGSGCHYDFLEIRNGGEDRSPLIGNFCGTNIPKTITSHGHVMYLRFKTDRTMSAKGFEILYDSGTVGCGGTLTTQTGSIESPGYPQPYGHNAECVWLISVSKGSTITLTVVDIDIEAHSTCRFDYLEVFNGNTDRSPSLGRFCNNRLATHYIESTSNVLFLKFKTDTSETGRGFRLNYQINCTTTVSGYRGVIESPNFPELYNHNANCTWHIMAPKGNNITIAFSQLLLEPDLNCRFDYLMISSYDFLINNSTQIARYCGTDNRVPKPFNTTTSEAIVNFVTDGSIAHIGFRLEWVAVGCGGDFIGKSFGEFNSPNWPHGYPHNTMCIWHIQATQGLSIRLTLNEFDIEGDLECHFDYFKVYVGPDTTSPLVMTKCHKIQDPETITSMGRAMTVVFSTDSSVRGKGFTASFSATGGSCSGLFTTETGSLTSPKYPSNYDSTDDCEYNIEVKGLHDIELTFDDFSMPLSVNCTESYLSIFDGQSSEAPLLLKHCGNAIPTQNPIRSTGNKVYLRMKADGRAVGKGFKISYKSMCGGRKVLAPNEIGELTSPNYPHHSVLNPECHWTIIASKPEERITLTFTHIDIAEALDCEHNYVEVRDGDSGGGTDLAASPLIGRYCGNRVIQPITSQGNALYITNSLGVFRATYATSTSACGGLFTSMEGYFQSPDYPNTYPLESECVWTIRSAPGNRVTFTFMSFNIEDSDYCNTDYVELREQDSAGPLLGRYCGQQMPTLNYTSTNVLWVKFRSDQTGTAQGFQAYYALEHGIELMGETGEIASPGYPHDFRPQEGVFSWSITVPRLKYISIVFTELSIHSFGSDCSSYVTVIDGIGEYAPELGRYCGFNIPDPISSSTNTLTVNFVMSSGIPGKFFLVWNAINETQALALKKPLITSSNTSFVISVNKTSSYRLTSPGYPTGYDNRLNYNWTFVTTQTFHFRINITDMNLEGNNRSCLYDRVNLLVPSKSSPSNWRINKTICGRYSGSFELPPIHMIRINFLTDSWVNRTGFDMTVYPVCGGTLYGSYGFISTDDIMNAIKCQWYVIVREGRTVQLTFQTIDISDNNNCQYSYVLIRNGRRSSSPILGRYCGRNIPVIPESASNMINIEFYALRNYHASFRLRFDEISIGCGGQLSLSETNRSVEIMSPGYPHPPTHSIECDWVVMSPTNTNMRFDFVYDQIGRWSCNTSTEFVDVRDGGTEVSPLIGKYCVPPQLVSTIRSAGNYMFVRFVTTNAENLVNFKANIRMNECGGTLFLTRTQEINIPDFPNRYNDNIECNYYLKAYYTSSYLEINITSIDIIANSDCTSGDYVEFRDDSPTGDLIGRYCGSNEENTSISFNSKSSTVFVTFKSDTSQTGKGLKLSARIVWSKCGTTIDNAISTGVITSPNYPNRATNYQYCNWFLFAPSGRSLKLTFLEFNLKVDPRNNTQCLDRLSVNKGTFSSSRITLNCGSVLPEPIQLQSHVAVVYFTSSGLAVREGFKLEYSADEEEICGGQLSEASGEITSYRFGEQNFTEQIDCVWDITAPFDTTNYSIALVFDVFELPSTPNCREGSLRLEYYNSRYRYFYHFGNTMCGNQTQNGKKLEFFAPNIALNSYGSPKLFLTTNYSNGNRGISGKYYIQECGGYFYNPEGEYFSPNYPNSYSLDSHCVWDFVVDWGQQFRISFIEFNLGDDCEKDYIQVTNGWLFDAPTSDKYCGTQLPPEVHSTARRMKVMFKGTAVNRLQTNRRFKMLVQRVEHGCGGLMLNNVGNIQSLNYGSNYDNNVECVWILQMPLGYHLNITFTDRFDLEMSDNCVNDYITFEELLRSDDDNSWSEFGRFCGLERPKPFKSRTNRVRVTFHTNGNIKGSGFKFIYNIACGEVFTGPSGAFTSPNYPNNYKNQIRCEYLILREPKDYIRLEFDDDFNVEPNPTCRWDAVDVYLGNTTSASHNGPYCGTEKPPIITSNAALLVTFKSDMSYVLKGFSASYTVSACGGNYTDPSGVISSPMRLTSYLQNMDCFWYISVEDNRAIELKFNFIDLQKCWNCYCDRVEIRDGDNSTAPLIGRFCDIDKDTGALIKSSGNKLWVHFRTDGRYERTGFRLAYRTTLGEAQGCGGLFINETNGVIQSPDIDSDGKYDLDLNCWFHFIVPEDKVIKITFEKLDIEDSPTNASKCMYDFIEVRDGLSHKSPLIDRFCGQTIPNPIIGSTNKLVLQFFSDSREVRTGFKARYEAIDRICGGFINVTNFTQTLQSVNYPNGYPPGLRCKWHFSFDRSVYRFYVNIWIKFNDLDINCNNEDYIEFNAESYTRHIITPYNMCGIKVPPMVVSKTGLWMTFITNSIPAPNHRGFSLNYTFSSCNQSYSEGSGLIVNTKYPDFTYSYFCQMNITANVGQTIALYFNDFNIYSEGRVGCPYGNMTIKDGIGSSAPIVLTICGSTLPQPIFSTGNQLSIETKGYSKFFISYTTTYDGRGCGGNLTSFNGTFTSPLYPSPYNQTKECKWFVHSFGLHSLTLRFTSFSLSSTIGCQSNYVEIYEGVEDMPTNRVQRICGDDNPAPYVSQGNVLLVKLVTNSNNNGPGFRAQYNFNSRELNATKGVMTSNLNPYITREGSVYFPTDGIMFRHN